MIYKHSSHILSCSVILWTIVSGYANVFTYEKKVDELFKYHGVVPDVISKAPEELAFVIHPSGVEAILGNEVTPTLTKESLAVAWNAKPEYYYTLAMVGDTTDYLYHTTSYCWLLGEPTPSSILTSVYSENKGLGTPKAAPALKLLCAAPHCNCPAFDPDVPSRASPTDREWLHWLVGNIRGKKENIDIEGEILAEYVSPAPGPHSDLHRYVFLVFQQSGKLVFDEPRLNNTSAASRPGFSITAFAKKYKLGEPVSGNFYRAPYDDYVPLVRSQLGDDSLLYCLTGEVKCD